MALILRRGFAYVAGALAALAVVLFLARLVGPAVVLLLAALFVALLGMGTGLRRAVPVRTPVDVPPEESEQVEGSVSACMRCGSVDVGGGSALQGQIPGAGDAFAWICRRCGHRGAPLVFDDVTAYRQFVKGLHEPRE